MTEQAQTQQTRVVATRLPHSLHVRLVQLSKREKRTKSNMLAVLLAEALQARDTTRARAETDTEQGA